MSRTYKKAYTGSKRFDSSCRNHGSCPYCKANRTFERQLDEFEDINEGLEEQIESLDLTEYHKGNHEIDFSSQDVKDVLLSRGHTIIEGFTFKQGMTKEEISEVLLELQKKIRLEMGLDKDGIE